MQGTYTEKKTGKKTEKRPEREPGRKIENSSSGKTAAYYHLPGLFEFYELYRVFLPLFYEHREWFYDWCEIGSIYGAPSDCSWGGGRVEWSGQTRTEDVLKLLRTYGISARLTFSNLLLEEKHLTDRNCNALCTLFSEDTATENGVIVASDLLLEYLRKNYPGLYLVSSTTKVLTAFEDLLTELQREEFRCVVPDFRLNGRMEQWEALDKKLRGKVEFLCNECCWFGCRERRRCYEAVSRKNLGENGPEHHCSAPEAEKGYRFSRAMKNPGFIGIDKIQQCYLPLGYSDFKIEGRGLGSALILEFLLYYLTRPEYQLQVREEIYLDNMLDLF